jgi:uncharacterized membrane protein
MGTREKKDKGLAQSTTGELVAYQQTELRVDVLPPPDEMQKYEKIHPGITKVMLDTYVSQVNHRIEIETVVIKGDNGRANRGQVISAALAFVCILLGGFLTYLDKNVAGLAMIFGSLGTLLTAFYGGAILRKIERVQKDKKSNDQR